MPKKKKRSAEEIYGEPLPEREIPPSRDVPVTYETVKDPAILQEIREYAESGCTLKQIARRLLVCESTLYKWSVKFPEVAEVIAEGNKVADDRVEKSLYDLCFPRDVREVVVEQDNGGQVIKRTIRTKHIPANATAIQYWLQNRRRDDWKSHQSLEFSGNTAVPVQIVYDLNTKEKPDIKGESD